MFRALIHFFELRRGRSPLHLAAMRGRLEIAQVLVAARADISIKNE